MSTTPIRFINVYRTGLRAFLVRDRNGHPKCYLWASSVDAAEGRSRSLAGYGATVAYANTYQVHA